MITYTPTSDGRAQNYNLAPGYYQASVADASEAWSKANNAMITLELRVSGPEGRTKILDNLVLTERAAWKIDQFRFALGERVTPGEAVNIDPATWIGKTLWVKTTLEPGQKNPDVEFPRIEQYLREEDCPMKGPLPPRPKPVAPQRQSRPVGGALPPSPNYDDDIPF